MFLICSGQYLPKVPQEQATNGGGGSVTQTAGKVHVACERKHSALQLSACGAEAWSELPRRPLPTSNSNYNGHIEYQNSMEFFSFLFSMIMLPHSLAEQSRMYRCTYTTYRLSSTYFLCDIMTALFPAVQCK